MPAPHIDTTGSGTACEANSDTTVSLSQLSSSSEKDLYIVVKDSAGNTSDSLKIQIPSYSAPPDNNTGDPPSTPTKPVIESKTEGTTTILTGTISGNTDHSGKASRSVKSTMAGALLDDAKKAEESGRKAVIELKLKSDKMPTSVEISISNALFSSFAA